MSGKISTLLAAAAMLVGGCNGDAAPDAGKYDQTWAKDYAHTTCREWNQSMSGRQKWTAAADMLTSARNKGDHGTGLPSDALVDEFEFGVTEACVIETATVADIGAGLYLTERARFRP